MRKVVFDIETRNTFQEVGKNDPTALDISLVGIFDSATESYQSFLLEELDKLWPILEQTDILIGYNSNHFDLPLLNKYYHGDLSQIHSLDILEKIQNSLGRRVRLDDVAAGTLGTKKSGHGLQAIQWWRQGDIESIRKYCLDDVKLTKEVYEYARKNNAVKCKNGNTEVLTIPIDASKWEEVEKSPMTQSLF